MRDIALSTLSGALMGIGFLIPSMWPLSLIGLVPLLSVLSKTEGRAKSAFLGFIFAITINGLAYWGVFWLILPVPWTIVDIPLPLQYLLVGTGWLYATLWTSLPMVVWAMAARTSSRRWDSLFVLPSLWVLAEFVGALFFSISEYAPGVAVGPHFTLSFVGNLIADDAALLQAAWLGGVFALSYIVIFVNVSVFLALRRRERRVLYGVLALPILLIAAHVFLTFESGEARGSRVSVAVVSSRFEIPDREHPLAQETMSRTARLMASAQQAEAIILPEGLGFLARPASVLAARELQTSPYLIIDSQMQRDGTKRMEYFDAKQKNSSYTYKYSLVPFGEYYPVWLRSVLTIVGYREKFAARTSSTLKSGPRPEPIQTPIGRVAALFCQEVLSPSLYQSQTKAGAEILINAASHVWYHDSRLIYAQMMRAAKIRAVENRRFFIQASNTSPSFVLDAYGRVVDESPWEKEGVLFADVYLSSLKTPYARLGLWWLIIPLLIVAASIAHRLRAGTSIL